MLSLRILVKAAGVLAALGLLAQAPASAQQFKGQIKVGIHRTKLEAGKFYVVKLTSTCSDAAFPIVECFPGRLIIVFAVNIRDDRMYLLPSKTEEHTFFVIAPLGPFQEAVVDYTLSVKAMPEFDKPMLAQKIKIEQNDPIYNNSKSRFKEVKLTMKANQSYVIHLAKTGNETPALFLEDAMMKVVSQDSFGGEDGGARIIYQPPQDGEFRLIATTTNNATAVMNLSVYALPK
jgi:hypothetical protein